jgi:hypothetical protein
MTAPWTSSDSTAKIIPAFVTALQTVEDVARNKKADIPTKTGGNVKYNYADLDAVLEATKPTLTANGLAVTQPAGSDGVRTVLLHTSGEWLAFPALLLNPMQASPQGQGSAISFARRYSLLAVLGVATEDDDGKAASTAPKTPRSTRPANTANPGTLAKPSQIQRLQIRLKEVGITRRDDAIATYIAFIGRTVTSSKQMTVVELAKVMDGLDRLEAGLIALVPNDDGTLTVKDAA